VKNEPIRILLVEDTPEDVQLLEHYLWQVRNLRYRLSHVGQLEAMKGVLRTEKFDVLVLDLNLPDSRGLSTLSTAMNQAPLMPIVVMTSVDDEATGVEAVRRGAQDYLVKGEVDGWLLIKAIRYAVERKRAQRESDSSLALAGEAQRALLPLRCPPGWKHFLATARNQMRSGVGGDFYDFLRINEGQIAVFIGDVMGHDVRAALLMAQILGSLRSEQRNGTVEIVSDLNRSLLALGDQIGTPLTCSLFYTILDASGGTISFVNAGHPPPYLCDPRTGKPQPLGSSGMLLGVQRLEPVEMSHPLGPGARMVLYTDGILDACNTDGERFGNRRLEDAIGKHVGQDPDGFADRIIAEVREFRQGVPQVDDESVVVVDRL
jgi:serine phosphatase RsbU (regulator of sigma subunit)